ncbi:hypothetical protein K438DRAFT_1977586 [Mycena galopus ATCC 62051]|nr:hypothetical protein K438DRAFT_1977586 [Mycena galopus ATCC 62051]
MACKLRPDGAPDKHLAADGAAALTTRRRPALRLGPGARTRSSDKDAYTPHHRRPVNDFHPHATIVFLGSLLLASSPHTKHLPALLVHVLLVRGRLAAVPSNLRPPRLRGGVAALEIIATHSATHSGSASSSHPRRPFVRDLSAPPLPFAPTHLRLLFRARARLGRMSLPRRHGGHRIRRGGEWEDERTVKYLGYLSAGSRSTNVELSMASVMAVPPSLFPAFTAAPSAPMPGVTVSQTARHRDSDEIPNVSYWPALLPFLLSLFLSF